MFRIIVSLILIVILVLGMSASAQTDDLLDIVIAAAENFANVSSYRLVMEISTAQQFLQRGTQLLSQEITQLGTGEALINKGDLAMAMDLDQTTHVEQGAQTVDVVVDMQIILVDNTLYVLFDNVSPSIAALYPTDWVNLTENPTAFPGAELINAETIISQTNAVLMYPLNEDTVLTITELPADEVNGETTRVFQLVMDAQAIFGNGLNDALSSMLNLNIPGISEEEFIRAMSEGMEAVLTFWIHEESMLPYQIGGDVTITLDMDASVLGAGSGTITLLQQHQILQTFSDFNEPVVITAPDA